MFNTERWTVLSERIYGYKAEKFSYDGFDIFYSHVKNDIGEYIIAPSFGDFILIDENNTFELAETKENKDMLYQLSHGKHTLKIYRNKNLIIDRIIFLEDHGTMEIIIP